MNPTGEKAWCQEILCLPCIEWQQQQRWASRVAKRFTHLHRCLGKVFIIDWTSWVKNGIFWVISLTFLGQKWNILGHKANIFGPSQIVYYLFYVDKFFWPKRYQIWADPNLIPDLKQAVKQSGNQSKSQLLVLRFGGYRLIGGVWLGMERGNCHWWLLGHFWWHWSLLVEGGCNLWWYLISCWWHYLLVALMLVAKPFGGTDVGGTTLWWLWSGPGSGHHWLLHSSCRLCSGQGRRGSYRIKRS